MVDITGLLFMVFVWVLSFITGFTTVKWLTTRARLEYTQNKYCTDGTEYIKNIEKLKSDICILKSEFENSKATSKYAKTDAIGVSVYSSDGKLLGTLLDGISTEDSLDDEWEYINIDDSIVQWLGEK